MKDHKLIYVMSCGHLSVFHGQVEWRTLLFDIPCAPCAGVRLETVEDGWRAVWKVTA